MSYPTHATAPSYSTFGPAFPDPTRFGSPGLFPGHGVADMPRSVLGFEGIAPQLMQHMLPLDDRYGFGRPGLTTLANAMTYQGGWGGAAGLPSPLMAALPPAGRSPAAQAQAMGFFAALHQEQRSDISIVRDTRLGPPNDLISQLHPNGDPIEFHAGNSYAVAWLDTENHQRHLCFDMQGPNGFSATHRVKLHEGDASSAPDQFLAMLARASRSVQQQACHQLPAGLAVAGPGGGGLGFAALGLMRELGHYNAGRRYLEGPSDFAQLPAYRRQVHAMLDRGAMSGRMSEFLATAPQHGEAYARGQRDMLEKCLDVLNQRLHRFAAAGSPAHGMSPGMGTGPGAGRWTVPGTRPGPDAGPGHETGFHPGGGGGGGGGGLGFPMSPAPSQLPRRDAGPEMFPAAFRAPTRGGPEIVELNPGDEASAGPARTDTAPTDGPPPLPPRSARVGEGTTSPPQPSSAPVSAQTQPPADKAARAHGTPEPAREPAKPKKTPPPPPERRTPPRSAATSTHPTHATPSPPSKATADAKPTAVKPDPAALNAPQDPPPASTPARPGSSPRTSAQGGDDTRPARLVPRRPAPPPPADTPPKRPPPPGTQDHTDGLPFGARPPQAKGTRPAPSSPTGRRAGSSTPPPGLQSGKPSTNGPIHRPGSAPAHGPVDARAAGAHQPAPVLITDAEKRTMEAELSILDAAPLPTVGDDRANRTDGADKPGSHAFATQPDGSTVPPKTPSAPPHAAQDWAAAPAAPPAGFAGSGRLDPSEKPSEKPSENSSVQPSVQPAISKAESGGVLPPLPGTIEDAAPPSSGEPTAPPPYAEVVSQPAPPASRSESSVASIWAPGSARGAVLAQSLNEVLSQMSEPGGLRKAFATRVLGRKPQAFNDVLNAQLLPHVAQMRAEHARRAPDEEKSTHGERAIRSVVRTHLAAGLTQLTPAQLDRLDARLTSNTGRMATLRDESHLMTRNSPSIERFAPKLRNIATDVMLTERTFLEVLGELRGLTPVDDVAKAG
ncbi:hypothetical protein [Roseateles amylovorans]|uniref:Uncharacterized protein n=1 Tax=Roseateles amylovorans TaxID=2978473 RepID=A0ABY6AUC0_9BURK|nr:hypothetical protein [Roseateles amylovorans]UXH76816.1 hypothetical protein N4261_17480 [Roseateles amylovorans]